MSFNCKIMNLGGAILRLGKPNHRCSLSTWWPMETRFCCSHGNRNV